VPQTGGRGIAHLTMMPGEPSSATTPGQMKTAEAPGPKSGGLFSDFRFENRSSQSEFNQPAVIFVAVIGPGRLVATDSTPAIVTVDVPATNTFVETAVLKVWVNTV